MSNTKTHLLLCYNKGCGQNYDPDKNTEESCVNHPGVPVFHDAYKGWSCCRKKCIDFTEFLNIKGCARSYHSNIKPEEPQKIIDKSDPHEIIEYKGPIPKAMERPPQNTPLVTLKPVVSSALKQQLASLVQSSGDKDTGSDGNGEIPLGTICKNNSCNRPFQGPGSLQTHCIYHPGYPVFHEGLKYWSCCTKRTTDFNTFLEQAGCSMGEHVWHKAETSNEVKCRLDWHQTARFIVVSVYAKKYNPEASVIQLSPVRLKISLHFPEENGSYENDMELVGIVDVNESSVQMLPTKVEIKLHKAEATCWSGLHTPQPATEPEPPTPQTIKYPMPRVDEIDLSGI